MTRQFSSYFQSCLNYHMSFLQVKVLTVYMFLIWIFIACLTIICTYESTRKFNEDEKTHNPTTQKKL